MDRSHLVRCLALVALLLGASYAATAQSVGDTSATGRRVTFPLMPFYDTLYTGVEGALRARFDEAGDVWYTTEGALVHVDVRNETREIFTKVEGLPSSYTMGLAVSGGKVYVGTDLGLGVVDIATGRVTGITPLNSPLPDIIVQEVAVLGADVWMGTRFYGVAIWNSTMPFEDSSAWTFKNTSSTTDHAKAVKRFVATPTTVWVATDGDGLWRYDRATRAWSVILQADGLPTNEVAGVAERDGALWVATARGLAMRAPSGQWRTYNTSDGLPDDRVTDVDVLPTSEGTLDVFASTRRGIWQLEPQSGRNATRAQSFGILGTYVFDNHFEPPHGWLFATHRGVSMMREGAWSYFATGPTDGPSWGPNTFGFTSAGVGEGRGFLWFGSMRGIHAYRLPSASEPGYWQNFAEWQNYPGSVVNAIDTAGNVTWFGTNSGTFGFEHETGRWIPKLASSSRNLVYGIEADRGELWIALFGDGLVRENLTTGLITSWDSRTLNNPLPDQYLTDVRADGDNVWLGASVGLIRMDRASGTFRGTYSTAEGMPGSGVVFRIEPDGAVVWVGTATGGVASFDVATGKVTRVWNETSHPGFPGGQVRSLHREGGRLWVGTSEGLARIDVASGGMRSWNQSNSPLVQDFVNGLSSAQGLLYVATLSGVQRMDIATGEFLPMRDGPGVVRAHADEATGGATRVTVRIESPRDGGAIAGPSQVRGTALAFGGKIDRVEVRVGEGPWTAAQGAESWTYDLDANALPANAPIAIAARAASGELTGQAEIVVTPVAPPEVPLQVEDIPVGDAYANRPLRLAARAQGDEPLSVSAYYRAPGSSGYTRLPMARTGDLFTASVPAREMKEGDLSYYVEAQSGLLFQTAGGTASDPRVVPVLPAPRLAVAIEGPASVQAQAGVETPFTLHVTNAGTERATFTVEASGLRASWVVVPGEDVELGPGDTRAMSVRLVVPQAAFADNTTLTFRARDSSGLAEPASASVPVTILASDDPVVPSVTPQKEGRALPFPAGLAILAIAVALVARRRSA